MPSLAHFGVLHYCVPRSAAFGSQTTRLSPEILTFFSHLFYCFLLTFIDFLLIFYCFLSISIDFSWFAKQIEAFRGLHHLRWTKGKAC